MRAQRSTGRVSTSESRRSWLLVGISRVRPDLLEDGRHGLGLQRRELVRCHGQLGVGPSPRGIDTARVRRSSSGASSRNVYGRPVKMP